MIVSFSVENYRSIHQSQELSLEAGSSKAFFDNVVSVPAKPDPLRLLKAAVVYGPNASGKSNLLRAFYALIWLVQHSADLSVGRSIDCYDPFRLAPKRATAPTSFTLVFVLDGVRYAYAISFDRTRILHERMTHYPEGRTALVFERQTENPDFDQVKLGAKIRKALTARKLFKNQLFLSQFGKVEPHPQLTPLYQYLDQVQIWNATDEMRLRKWHQQQLHELLNEDPEGQLLRRLEALISSLDTGITALQVRGAEEEDFQFPGFFPDAVREQVIQQYNMQVFAYHPVYEGEQLIGQEAFKLEEESRGTQVLFGLAGLILTVLDQGGVLMFDELDNSLHPDIVRFLVQLFLNPTSNPHGAQLIVATHEVSLLEKGLLRRDQIWFTQKNQQGETELYSVYDFDGIREDSAFDRLYRNGKFQALPKVKSSRYLYETPQA
ncbi:MAG: ATP-binding protein [Bacteroidota bacterium]